MGLFKLTLERSFPNHPASSGEFCESLRQTGGFFNEFNRFKWIKIIKGKKSDLHDRFFVVIRIILWTIPLASLSFPKIKGIVREISHNHINITYIFKKWVSNWMI